MKSQATNEDRVKLVNELKSKYPGLSDEEYTNAVQELENQVLGAGGDVNKQRALGSAMERNLKDKSKAAQQFNEAVNYFTTDQKVINTYPTLRGFDPNNPTPEQIQLLKRIASLF